MVLIIFQLRYYFSKLYYDLDVAGYVYNSLDVLKGRGWYYSTWHPNPDYKGEIYFLNNPNNKAEFQYFSPNKLIAKVSVRQPDTLIINQNYDESWR